MNLIPINIDSIVVGQPLPCALRDEGGTLLANKGFLVNNRLELQVMLGKREHIYIDFDQSDNFRRAYVNRLNNLVMEDRAIGQIADVQMASYGLKKPNPADFVDDADWLDLQTQAHGILRDTQGDSFLPRLERLQTALDKYTQRNPDGTLFALINIAGSETRHYSATHALLVAVVCTVAAREVLKWPEDEIKSLCSAALTMNIGMTDLHDRLTVQIEPPTPEQIKRIETHAPRSVDMLQQMGVADRLWLEAVLNHRAQVPGPLAKRTPGKRLARLIQRADMFAARLSPRASRAPGTPASAMQSCYFDENREIDEAGAALIKAVGIYSPGTYVRLTTNEVAIVVKRGLNTTMPRVAVLINRQGMPTGEPILRETSQAEFRIVASVPHREVKINHNLDRLLALTKPSALDRPW